ncbi:right-handed parallel beta-helix repeat-containing protein [Wenzhouxiangella sp. XN201]|uniref:right-handed parallel beta-helix repeat-containing protein n=1 Tax=Wenzhouxiangella sp. XN201 TaxID=2710755 RepID=UPI0013CAD7F8|nr:right-handed parallel beta-helix repeat-containing protein [Wenzhouxiangella sp. XN201]NEZ03099.1 right-handed parallel beta-helix repeat-containing protein [Wenzhouxiangella sp. XN201]
MIKQSLKPISCRSTNLSPRQAGRVTAVNVHRPGWCAFLTLLLILASLSAAPVSARVIWVGPNSDGNCETNSLSAAVLTAAFAAGDDAIHLANGVAHTDINLALNGFDPGTSTGGLSIRGGFASCGDGTPTAGRTTIDGGASNPIFEISGSSGGSSVIELVDLELSGSGVRALEVGNGGELDLNNVWVRNNGGAVRVQGNGRFSMESESWLFDNTVSGGFGGGLYCTDDAVVNVGGPISNNFAGQWGGGIYARGSCQVILRNKAWIQSNTATFNGGGIAAFSSALVTLSASETTQILVKNNSAERGGGIYAEGAETNVLLANAKIENNQAERGAAVYATQNSYVQIYRIPVDSCADPLRCSTLSFNQLGDDFFGAVAWVDQGARISISETYMEGNSSSAGREDQISLLAVSDESSSLSLSNVMVWDNEARYIAERIGTSQIRFEHVTTADNFYPTTSGTAPISLFLGTDSVSATVINSLLWDVGSSGNFGGSCNFAASSAALSDSTASAAIADPRFIAAAGGDLRLEPDSPAVDACFSGSAGRDIELQDRPADVEGNANGNPGQAGGLFDAGSGEVVLTLFADRFEEGGF